MSGIPIVPGSEIDVQTPGSGAPISPGAFQSEAGMHAMAGAFGQIAGEAGSVNNELIRAHEAGVAAAVDLKMRTARQSFLDSLRNDSDEQWRGPNDSNWKDRAAEVATQVHEDIFSQHTGVTPDMKRQMESAFNSWSGSLLIESQSMANVQMTNRAWGRTQQDYQEALKDDHADHALNLLENARRNKLADPELIDSLERNIPKTVASNYINNGFATNPKGTLDLLRSGGSLPAVGADGKPIVPSKAFTPKELEALINTGRIRTDAWQRQNSETLLKDDVDPTTGLVPEATIRQKMEAGEITEKFGNGQIKAQEEAVKKKTREEAVALKAKDEEQFHLIAARAHDPVAWGSEPDEYAHMLTQDAASISDPALKQQAINEVSHQMGAVKKTAATADRPVERQMYELMNKDLMTQGAMVPLSVEDVAAGAPKSHFFSKNELGTAATTRYVHVAGGLGELDKLKEEGGDEPWPFPGVSKEKVVAAANDHNARLQSQMRDWFASKEGQDATFEQADNHRKELEKPYVMDAVRNSLSRKAPATVSTKEEFDALPSGAPFTWNGQVGTKN